LRSDHDLRIKLDDLTMPPSDLTEWSGDSNWEDWLTTQITKITDLAIKHPHNIRLHRRSMPSRNHLNCFALALGIGPIVATDPAGQYLYPEGPFMAQLLEKDCLEERHVTACQASDCDLLFYYKSDSCWPKHAGRWRNGRVISKWGACRTHTWRHPPFEVPACYGEQIKVYKPIPRQLAKRAYLDWATLRLP
jgi:hypothetical protein